ncbi:MAG: ATP-binding protein [Candidatus Krumholzibacteria bacterium]|jgi:nitrogen fixation/metabolism regulation signal transduction histidine kinase|nr:ATP-binding protein [Candidatus Krumholzibacteria bacterium]
MKRISTRLAISFLLVALLPTLPLSLVVRDLLERRFGPAIADPLEHALEAGLAESRAYFQLLRAQFQSRAAAVAVVADEQVVLLDDQGRAQPAGALATLLAARPELLGNAAALPITAGETVAVPERFGDVLATAVARDGGAPVVVLQHLPVGMMDSARALTEGLGLLRAVRGEQGRVVLSFVGPFLLVYAVLILVALGAGALWTRRMVTPLEALVGATRRVAGGDLEFRVAAHGPGEVGELVRSFDTMISRLLEQRRDLARLERAAAWRGMARTLAHEVKNPLTPILLAVQEMRDSYRGGDERYRALLDECTTIVGEEVESLRRLVREFGEFAKLPKPELRRDDLSELARDLQHLYGERLTLGGGATPLCGWFDAGAMRRALINLIDNGLAACREAGVPERVEISLAPATPGACLTVRDRGSGIRAEDLDRIFEPDFTTKGDGMGLGLAIVQGIVAGHGGVVRVASTPGVGTAFTIELPLTPVGAGLDPDGEVEA